jgi:putative tryptophan/tyrosine transport system substrate-binding protein
VTDLRRREFMTLLGGAAAAWPAAAGAQQSARIPRIGIIDDAPIWDHFRRALLERGYIEGKNIAFEYRAADGKPERLAVAAAELARTPVDAIATYGTPATRAAKLATTTIPIVMISVGDPVRTGLVASFSRPGENITGLTILSPDETPKRLQLLREILPSISRVAFLWNPSNASNAAQLEELQLAAPKLGLRLLPVAARTSDELNETLGTVMTNRADAFLMTGDPVHQGAITRIVNFLLKNKLPSMFLIRENVLAGGLMCYGASQPDLFRRAAVYVQKILHGIKPADLPVEQPTKFELVVNVKAAKAIGLTVSPTLLALADEVIE